MSAFLIISLLALIFGLILGFAAIKFKVESDPLVEQLDAILPQTQCADNAAIPAVALMRKP